MSAQYTGLSKLPPPGDGKCITWLREIMRGNLNTWGLSLNGSLHCGSDCEIVIRVPWEPCSILGTVI